MKKIERHSLTPYSAEEMFNLINDIESYPEFLPWCSKSHLELKNEKEIRATVEVSHSGLTKKFTTHNYLHPHKRIEMDLVDGPFKYLQGTWFFEDLNGEGCTVDFYTVSLRDPSV